MPICSLLFIKLDPNCITGRHFISWKYKTSCQCVGTKQPSVARAINLTDWLLLDICLIQIRHWDYWSSNRSSVDRQTKKNIQLYFQRQKQFLEEKINQKSLWNTENLYCTTGLVKLRWLEGYSMAVLWQLLGESVSLWDLMI